jgi:dTDP-4-dehydrorhamnose 3,5-epimerase
LNQNRVSEIQGVRVMPLKSSDDSRGSFTKFNPQVDLRDYLDSIAISHNNAKATIRGLHFQIEPFAEEKLVTCLQGSIFDVVLDLRENSKTFGKWTSYELNSKNRLQVYLPKGLAHGYQTLQPNSIVQYVLSAPHSPLHSFSINPFDQVGVAWPLNNPVLSKKDEAGISLIDAVQKYAQSLNKQFS